MSDAHATLADAQPAVEPASEGQRTVRTDRLRIPRHAARKEEMDRYNSKQFGITNGNWKLLKEKKRKELHGKKKQGKDPDHMRRNRYRHNSFFE